MVFLKKSLIPGLSLLAVAALPLGAFADESSATPVPPVEFPYDLTKLYGLLDVSKEGEFPLKFVCSTHGAEWLYAYSLSRAYSEYLTDSAFEWSLGGALSFVPNVVKGDVEVVVSSAHWVDYVKASKGYPVAEKTGQTPLPLFFPNQFSQYVAPISPTYYRGIGPLQSRPCKITYNFVHPDLGYPVVGRFVVDAAGKRTVVEDSSVTVAAVEIVGNYVAVPHDAPWDPSVASVALMSSELGSAQADVAAGKARIVELEAKAKAQETALKFQESEVNRLRTEVLKLRNEANRFDTLITRLRSRVRNLLNF